MTNVLSSYSPGFLTLALKLAFPCFFFDARWQYENGSCNNWATPEEEQQF